MKVRLVKQIIENNITANKIMLSDFTFMTNDTTKIALKIRNNVHTINDIEFRGEDLELNNWGKNIEATFCWYSNFWRINIMNGSLHTEEHSYLRGKGIHMIDCFNSVITDSKILYCDYSIKIEGVS